MTDFFAGDIGLSTAIQGTLVLLVGLGALRLLRRARASVRHMIVAATFGGLLILPLAFALVPPVVVFEAPVVEMRGHTAPLAMSAGPAGLSAGAVAKTSAHAGIREENAHWLTWSTLVQWVWAAGVVTILARLGAGLWRITRIRRSGLPWVTGRALVCTLGAECGAHRPVDVLLHEEIAAPFTAGLRSPAIVLPPDACHWPDADLRRALVHELEHVRRRDWAAELTARIVCALNWYNPLAWIALRRLCLEAERACDDAVVTRDGAAEYAEQLVALAERVKKGPAPQPALAMARRSDLSARVCAILDLSQRRGPPGLATAVVTLSAMAIAVMSITSVRAQPASADASARTSTRIARDAAETQRRPGPIDRALYEFAEEGDLDSISKLLSVGANVDVAIAGDGSPLMGAARRGRVEAVRLLLDRGADPSMPVRGDGNPLIIAAREGHLGVVALLLDRGANVDQVVAGDENALI